jgi:nicotinate-nucleotide pyrophosphorylase
LWDYGLIDNDEWFDLHSMSENSEKNVQICINKMNELADENEQLKLELNTYKEANTLLKQTIDRLLTDNIQYKTKLNEQMKKEYKKNE